MKMSNRKRRPRNILKYHEQPRNACSRLVGLMKLGKISLLTAFCCLVSLNLRAETLQLIFRSGPAAQSFLRPLSHTVCKMCWGCFFPSRLVEAGWYSWSRARLITDVHQPPRTQALRKG